MQFHACHVPTHLSRSINVGLVWYMYMWTVGKLRKPRPLECHNYHNDWCMQRIEACRRIWHHAVHDDFAIAK